MTLLICQNASTERWPQPSTWYHSSAVGERRDQRRVVDRDDRRVEHVAGRQRVADLEQVAAAEARGPAGAPVRRARPEVDEVDRLAVASR